MEGRPRIWHTAVPSIHKSLSHSISQPYWPLTLGRVLLIEPAFPIRPCRDPNPSTKLPRGTETTGITEGGWGVTFCTANPKTALQEILMLAWYLVFFLASKLFRPH